MQRCALPLILALVGCAKPNERPSVVTLPEGLGRRSSPPAPVGPFPVVSQRSTPPPPKAPLDLPVPPAMKPSIIAPAHRTVVSSAPSRIVPVGGLTPVPKADETRSLAYRVPEGAVEVEGVCSFTERDVTCWDGARKPAPNLASSIRSALSPNANDTYRGNLNLRFGKKNRIVVLRHEQVPFRGGQGAVQRSLNLGPLGDDPAQGYGGSINLPVESPDFQTHSPFVTHEARIVAFDPDARTTKVRIVVNEGIPNPAELPIKKGASVTFAGVRFTVRSIQKGQPRDVTVDFGGDRRQQWTVTVAREGNPTRPATFSASASEMLFRDAKGHLAPREAYERWIVDARKNEGIRIGKMPFEPIRVFGISDREGAMRVVMDVDPAEVKTLRLNGSFLRNVDVTGIPLDPR